MRSTQPVSGQETRVCRICEKSLPLEEFYKRSVKNDGTPVYRTECKGCIKYKTAKWVESNYDRYRSQKAKSARLRRYGLEDEDYQAMMEAQGGKCAICKREPPEGQVLQTDHCHKSGVVRGLICNRCNTQLGWIEEEPERLGVVVDYLLSPLKRFQEIKYATR